MLRNQTRKILCVCFIMVSIAIAILSIYDQPASTTLNSHRSWPARPDISPHFAVMILTEECLPDHMLRDDYFGNSIGCDCYVYVLSYRRQCNKNNKTHISYTFNKTLGWSGARNLVYFVAKNSKHNYLYYIFIDDDIHLEYNNWTPKKLRNVPPFQIFASFLLEYLPAGAVTEYQSTNRADVLLRAWHWKCEKYNVPYVFSVKHADPCFQAIHRDAASVVLPYTESFDKNAGFWVSGVQLSLTYQLAFFGQYIYFPYIRAMNPLHRYNTHGHVDNPEVRQRVVDNIKRFVPPEYKNHSGYTFMMNLKVISRIYLWCKEPALPKSPIIPYRWMHDFVPDDWWEGVNWRVYF